MSDGKWRVTASRHIHKDRWISVRADDCVTDEGAVIAPYYVLEYPDWVEVVALDADNNVLLVKQYRHALGDISVELPAGGMDPGETDPVEAARRELLEEAGCQGTLSLVGETRPNAGTHTNRTHIILARDVVKVAEPQDEPSERIESVWVSLPEAIRMALTGEITVGMQAASLLRGLAAAGVIEMTMAPRMGG
ncbi:NUDIX hydrolase [Caulobacter segnis]|uniref:NUDIX hydrolase n=2 Tax=Caulobacter segnis TaxID=88688 RepID=D5VPX8_CAUST|nr:NUDIX hydrolase [Caulobacter segnis]ADG12551.1 NUDIX hydrolase [Caulobacter segnis ATCC 21756]AVQ04129.1 NUDIX hydrolase [Caulobacter segnis]